MKMGSGIASLPVPASRTPQRRRGRDRVAGLTAAAAALFLEKGFEAATMTEIALRAGASIGSLYLFFPTKLALAQALLTERAAILSARLDELRMRAAGRDAAAIADALLDELARFLAAHPVYATLIDLPGDEAWRRTVRARRRQQIAALFAEADPPLPAGQPERLAVIVPQVMRIPMTLGADALPLRDAVMDELRAMLRHHLQPSRQRVAQKD